MSAKKSKGRIKFIEGAVIGAVMGIVAGVMMAPESGKKTRKNLMKKTAEFYKYLGAKLQDVKEVSEDEYHELVKIAMDGYSKAKKLTAEEAKEILKEAEHYWKELKKLV